MAIGATNRAAVMRGNKLLRKRKELRLLDDKTLARRLGKYMGRTMSEIWNEYHAVSQRDLGGTARENIIDAIVHYEVQ